jgi:hypothetical protein
MLQQTRANRLLVTAEGSGEETPRIKEHVCFIGCRSRYATDHEIEETQDPMLRVVMVLSSAGDLQQNYDC